MDEVEEQGKEWVRTEVSLWESCGDCNQGITKGVVHCGNTPSTNLEW